MNEASRAAIGFDPIVREASSIDAQVLTFLDEQGRGLLEGQRGGDAWITEHPPVSTLLTDSRTRVLVAELTGCVIGFLTTIDTEDPMRGRLCCIERVYVDVDARGIGCGDALLAEAVGRARQRSCVFVEGEALPGDRETKNLYERAGITARRITVSKRLSDPSTAVPASR